MKYFLDNMISYKFADMLRALDVEIAALRHEFEEDIKDPELLTQLKNRKLVFISNDKHQLTRETEAKLLKDAKVTAIYFEPFWSKMDFWQQATWLIKYWPKIEQFSNSAAFGTCGRMKQGGRIHVFNF